MRSILIAPRSTTTPPDVLNPFTLRGNPRIGQPAETTRVNSYDDGPAAVIISFKALMRDDFSAT
jgi:hypothetical protein